MKMTVDIPLLILIVTQQFSAGMYYKSQCDWAKGFKEWTLLLFKTAFIMVAGFPLALLIFTAALLLWFYRTVINGLHLPFIIKYVILKRPLLEYSDMKFKVMKGSAIIKKQKLRWYKFDDIIYIKLVAWIAKNYEKGGKHVQ